MSEARAGGTVSSYTVIGNVDVNGKAQPLSAAPLNATVEQTAFTYDTDGNLTSYVENGRTWTLTYDATGNLLSITGS